MHVYVCNIFLYGRHDVVQWTETLLYSTLLTLRNTENGGYTNFAHFVQFIFEVVRYLPKQNVSQTNKTRTTLNLLSWRQGISTNEQLYRPIIA